MADATKEETEKAFAVPAFVCNRYLVNVMANGVRLAFAEQGGPDATPNFRVGVFLSFPDAVELHTLLQAMLAPLGDQIAGLNKTAATDSSNA